MVLTMVCLFTCRGSHRADVQREDEDDEEAQEPGEEGGEQDHPMLLVKISISVEQEEREEEHHHHLQRECYTTHPECSVSHQTRQTGTGHSINTSTVWTEQLHHDS